MLIYLRPPLSLKSTPDWVEVLELLPQVDQCRCTTIMFTELPTLTRIQSRNVTGVHGQAARRHSHFRKVDLGGSVDPRRPTVAHRCRRGAVTSSEPDAGDPPPAPPHRPTPFEARGTARPGSAWIRLQKAASRARKRRTLGCDRHDAARRIEDDCLHDRRSGVDAWEEFLHPGPPSHRGIRPAGPGTQRP